jgi:hypothetical protein
VTSVYIDESKAQGFYMAAAAIPSAQIREVRRTIRGLLYPGQSRLHMVSEKSPRRHQILDALCALELDVTIYGRELAGKKQLDQRAACIAGIVEDAVRLGHQRLVFERDETLVNLDRQALIEASRKHRFSLDYEHLRASEELLLGIPDAIVWAWARGGGWRQQINSCSTFRLDC